MILEYLVLLIKLALLYFILYILSENKELINLNTVNDGRGRRFPTRSRAKRTTREKSELNRINK